MIIHLSHIRTLHVACFVHIFPPICRASWLQFPLVGLNTQELLEAYAKKQKRTLIWRRIGDIWPLVGKGGERERSVRDRKAKWQSAFRRKRRQISFGVFSITVPTAETTAAVLDQCRILYTP
ncbi:hypothetical protein Nepgr_002380 [Nepenthes gracilis]|uniref:Uncharacterized protein n=1 Tax=Nepenthes gracilis TaxID=150966 RepID=A0AAD3P6Q5_NEPGR|nr:hypothetical protein Nepgr_002380 [Nepenthes gracilis]